MIKLLILLSFSNIIYLKCNICESFQDCYNCTSNFDCIWNSNNCETKIENNNEKEWWRLFSKCIENNNNNIYCGESKIKDLGHQIQSLSLLNINEGYGIAGLLCSYYFNYEKKRNNLEIEYSIKTTVYNIAYPKISMKFYFTNDTSSIIQLTKNIKFNFNKIKKIEIYVLCYEKYYYNPFLITFLTKNKRDNVTSAIFILLAIIIIIIIIISILNYICSKKKRTININEIRNENENNILSSNRRMDNFNRIDIIYDIFKSIITEINYKDLIKNNKSKEKCSICLEGFQEEKEKPKNTIFNNQHKNTIIKTPCEHYFHYICLFSWLSKNHENMKCPNCNFQFVNENDKLILNSNNFHHRYSSSNNYIFNNISRSGSTRNINISSNNMRILSLNINN